MAIPIAKQYILDYEQMGMGMFVHFGLYSQIGKGEWIYHIGKMNMDEYEKLADTFTAEDFDAYLEYLRKSVEILCKNYGKIGGLWFYGDWSKPGVDWKHDELYATIRKYQPEAMIINNTGLWKRGEIGYPEIDAVTFEQGTPKAMKRDGMAKYLAAEMCHTVNDHWGYGYDDLNYKSPAELIKSLCDCRRVGANYLLNIGPEAQGKVNAYQRELFGLIGRWMARFGEAVYNGRPYNSSGAGKNFVLKSVDGKCLYLFVYDLGSCGNTNVTIAGKYAGAYSFGNVQDKVSSIKWMDEDEGLTFAQCGDMLNVNLTGHPYGKQYPVRVAKAIIE